MYSDECPIRDSRIDPPRLQRRKAFRVSPCPRYQSVSRAQQDPIQQSITSALGFRPRVAGRRRRDLAHNSKRRNSNAPSYGLVGLNLSISSARNTSGLTRCCSLSAWMRWVVTAIISVNYRRLLHALRAFPGTTHRYPFRIRFPGRVDRDETPWPTRSRPEPAEPADP